MTLSHPLQPGGLHVLVYVRDGIAPVVVQASKHVLRTHSRPFTPRYSSPASGLTKMIRFRQGPPQCLRPARQNLSLGQIEMNNSAPFPAVYRVKGAIRTAALATLATSLIFSAGIVSRVKLGLQQPSAETALMISLATLCTVVFALHVFTSSLRFTDDALEKSSILTVASIPHSQIRGRRQIGHRGDQANIRFYVIVPAHRSLPTIKFAEYHEFDDAFYDWFFSLPDLDAKAK